MVSFNWVDIIICLILVAAVYSGIRVGFLTLLFTFGSFFGSLFALGWLLPHILPLHGSTALVVISGNAIFIACVFIAFHAYDYGVHLHRSFGEGTAHIIESVAGITLSLGSAFIAVWLIAAALVSLPFVGLSNTVDNSLIVQFLSDSLPPAPAVFEQFSTLVNPNTTPKVFVKNVPNAANGVVLSSIVSSAVKVNSQSVVRITGFGCSSIISGSGFVVAPGLIATNAHVIAGVNRPIIKYGSKSYTSTPVLFDANLDFALLRVDTLNLRPLQLDNASVNKGTMIETIGYPASIFTISNGLVTDSLQISGPNIYGLGTIIRSIYVIESPIAQGLSGGPVVLPSGAVVGVIFASSSNTGGYGYAITASALSSDISKALTLHKTVGTGTCVE